MKSENLRRMIQHTHTSTHTYTHTSTHTIPPSIITLTHSLRSFALRRSSLTAGVPWSCFMGGLPPLWSIERSSAVGGRYPPCFAGPVLRRGAPGSCGGFTPLWSIERSSAVSWRYPPTSTATNITPDLFLLTCHHEYLIIRSPPDVIHFC